MNRRTLIAAAAIPLGVGTVGCSMASGQSVALADPEIETQQGGRETYRIYHHDGEKIIAVGFRQGSTPDSLTDRFTFGITLSYSEAATVESFQFDLRASQSLSDPPADIHLRSPGKAWSGLTYGPVGVEGRQWTRIALPETGEHGDETIYITTVIDPTRAPAERIDIRTELDLASRGVEGTTYRVADNTTFEPTTEPVGETTTE